MKRACKLALPLVCLACLVAWQPAGAETAPQRCDTTDQSYEQLVEFLRDDPPKVKCATALVDGLSPREQAKSVGMLCMETEKILWEYGILYQIHRGQGRLGIPVALRHVNVEDFDPYFIETLWKLESVEALEFIARLWEQLVAMSRSDDARKQSAAGRVICRADVCTDDELKEITAKAKELRAIIAGHQADN